MSTPSNSRTVDDAARGAPRALAAGSASSDGSSLAAARRAFALATAGLLIAGVGAAQQDEDDANRPRGFAIPHTREAATLAQRALDHLAARRDSEAIQLLHELIVSHRGEVLIAPGAAAPDDASPVYVGAVEWAQRELSQLPAATLQSYRSRFEAQASAELELALDARDARALSEVARRYPRTLAAARAWRALGDFEAERDDLAAAGMAWRRAQELERALGLPDTPGAAAREEQLARWRAAPGDLAGASAPGPQAATWAAPLSPENAGGPFARGESYALHACVSEDAVFVSDTLRVWSFDAWSGERRWVSDEAPEWLAVDRGQVHPAGERPLRRDDFFEQVDRSQILVRPAAGGGVVVAAIQAPFSLVGKRNYQQFSITAVTPERRLVGFDARTGRTLWSHLPPLAWDGESGPYELRMSVGAAPTVAGSRVLVGTHRMRGRVDFHVACFDLHDGRLLWSTPLVSGQVELNMFGRPEREFTAAPVTVDGERVFVATQLGAVAALDLFSGDILWETLYEQMPIPKAQHWRTEMRRQHFANAAPALAGNALVVTPIDAREMIAFDVATGARLWRRPHDFFSRSPQVLTLLGARPDAVWLSGERVLIARAPRGVASNAGPSGLEQSAELFNTQPRPRPHVAADHVVVPGASRRIALDRQRLSEDRRASGEWSPGQAAGNALLTDGAAYFVSDSRVSGAVDWRVLSERFARQMADAPDDPRPHLGWAAVLARRGVAELSAGANESAASSLQAAAQGLEPWLATPDPQLRTLARSRFTEAALNCADALARSAALKQALHWTERAREVAGDPESTCRALVRKAEFEQALKRPSERMQTLEALLECCGDAPMPADWRERDDARRYANLGAGQRLHTLTVGAYVAVERALQARREQNAVQEFEALHAILAHHGDLRLPPDPLRRVEPSATLVSARIGELIAAGERAAYEPYERAAAEHLARAKERDDYEQLERLASLYPHSQAAAFAERWRREAALARADLPSVARLCVRATPDDWNPGAAGDDELHAQWVLRAAFAEAGNHEFAAALFARLEPEHGARVSPLARDRGRTLGELREESLQEHRTAPPVRTAIEPSSTPMRALDGSFLLLGATPVATAEGPPQWAQILCRRDRRFDIVSAWSGESTERPLWSAQTPQGAAFPGWRAQFAADTVILGNRSGLLALESDTGEVRWQWSAGAARVDSFQARSGVVLVGLSASESNSVLALDARLGLELWARPIPPQSWSRPVVGEHAVVFLPSDFAQTPAYVLDLFTGARIASVPLPIHVGLADAEGAWIEHGRLIVPSFPKSSASGEQDCLTAWDLASGRRAWRVVSEAQHEFDSILRADGRSYLVMLPRSGGARGANGAVLDLDARIGAVRRVPNVTLSPHDVLVGVARHRVVESSHPYLFVRSEGPDGASTLVRALHLPFGERWSVSLDIAPSQLNSAGPMPAPLVSERTVVLLYTHVPRSKNPRGALNAGLSASMVLVDRESGVVRERSALPADLGTADKLEFAALGSNLWISGPNQMLLRR